jgi:hypothetical protein
MGQSSNFDEQAGAALMSYFRDYRAQIDQEQVERHTDEPSSSGE